MAIAHTTYIDELDIARHLKANPEEAFEVIAQLADLFSKAEDAIAWMAETAKANSGAQYHELVGPFLRGWGNQIIDGGEHALKAALVGDVA